MLQEDFRVLLVCSERSEGWSSGNSGQTLYGRCTADLEIVALLCNAGILRISKLSVFNTDGGFDSRRPTYNIFVFNSLQKKSRRNGRMNSNPKPFRIRWLFTSLRYPLQVVVAVSTIFVTTDHRLVRYGIDCNSLLNHPVEEFASVLGASTIKPEGEFIEIKFEVLLADCALVRA